ncbi:MAG TPA: hypothetical protein VIG62_16800, partial [Blastocatellia bacterium]
IILILAIAVFWYIRSGRLDAFLKDQIVSALSDYGIGAQILHDLGLRKMRLITNHPVKRAALDGFGLEITDREPIEIEPNETNEKVLRARKEKLGHLLTKV